MQSAMTIILSKGIDVTPVINMCWIIKKTCPINIINVTIGLTTFTLCVELSNTNEYNSSKFLNSLPSFEIISEASKFSQSNDVDLSLAFQNDCSYYSVNELCGDFNIDLLKIENNQNYHQFL